MERALFTVIWEFLIQDGLIDKFEAAYGSEGDWVRLFRRSPDYLGTSLLQDLNNPRRYLTLDRWKSSAAYETFREQNTAAYQAIDRACEGWTERETEIGRFTE